MGFGMSVAAVAAAALTLYIYRLNQIIFAVPEDALKLSPHRWTDDEIRETYERVCQKPIDYEKDTPPKLDRRYIVVGGSGLVGGHIIQQLLQRGQPAATIRIVDFMPPTRADLLSQGISFVQADITDAAATTAAFTKPWPTTSASNSSIDLLPLTVFHTAAIIRPFERTPATWHRTEPVNVTGTRNVLAATQAAASSSSSSPTIFIFTSSVSVAARPCAFLTTPPWAPHPRNTLQLLDERDFDAPLRSRGEFFANYAYSKAIAERFVCAANNTTTTTNNNNNGALLRTACLRPGGGIYGMPRDLVLVDYLRRGTTNSGFAPQTVMSFVSARNVALAQLQLEAALLLDGEAGEQGVVGGRPYAVTDPGPPPAWSDWYRAAEMLARPPTAIVILPPLPLYLLALGMEAWIGLLLRFPLLKKLGLNEPTGDLQNLQPGIFTAMEYMIVVDDRARKSVEGGGFGYRGGATTLEGVCEVIRDWNLLQKGQSTA